eukprot:4296931-Alexandrium_andersonii.AAC.2
MQIFVQLPNGRRVPVEVEPCQKVKDVKITVEDLTGVPARWANNEIAQACAGLAANQVAWSIGIRNIGIRRIRTRRVRIRIRRIRRTRGIRGQVG